MTEATPLNKRRSWIVRTALLIIGLVLLGCGLLAFRSLNLSETPWLPKCLYHELTGLHCPGCGITRALQALAQWNIPQAFAYNALWPIAVLLTLPYLLKKTWYWMLGTRPAVGKSSTGLYVVLGSLLGLVVVMFTILRNLPGEPWCYLAPHELP
jgi:hypothetical protein